MIGKGTRCRLAIGTVVLLFACAVFAAAQPPGGPPGSLGGRPGGPRGGPGLLGNAAGMLELLQRPDVRKELELVDDQVQQLSDLRDTMRESLRNTMREAFTRIRDLPREQRAEAMREAVDKVGEDIRSRLSDVLLPHQMKRLEQIALQQRLRGGLVALWNDEIVEKLGIDQQQRERLRAKAAEVEQQLRRKIAEMRNQARQELLSLLTPQQRAAFEELVGEPFEFQTLPRPENEPARQPDTSDR